MAAPKAVETASAIAKASNGCMSYQLTSTEISTPVNAITAPTERSMPPDRMTKVMPTAAMPRKALSVKRLPATRVDSMFGNWNTQTA